LGVKRPKWGGGTAGHVSFGEIQKPGVSEWNVKKETERAIFLGVCVGRERCGIKTTVLKRGER